MAVILRSPFAAGALFVEGDGAFMEFDATMSEQVTDEAEVTSHPVEDGTDISDHVQLKPRQLSLTQLATNAPLFATPEPDRDILLHQQLRDMQKRKEPVTVVTGLDVYDNMVIKTISTGRDRSTGQALPIAINLTEVIIANQEVVTVPASVLAARAKRSGKSKKDGGKQSTEELGLVTAQEGSAAGAGAVGIGVGGVGDQGTGVGVGGTQGAGVGVGAVPPTTGGEEPAPEKTKADAQDEDTSNNGGKTTLKKMADSFS